MGIQRLNINLKKDLGRLLPATCQDEQEGQDQALGSLSSEQPQTSVPGLPKACSWYLHSQGWGQQEQRSSGYSRKHLLRKLQETLQLLGGLFVKVRLS